MDIFGNFSKFEGDKSKRKVAEHKELDFSYADTFADPVGKIESKTFSQSFWNYKFLIIAVFGIMILRLFFFQVVQGSAFQKMADGNRILPRVIEATRGLVTDKNGVWLARNKPSFALAVYPSDLPKKKIDREPVYQKLSDISGLTTDYIRQESEKNGLTSLGEILLKEDISHDDALILEERIAGLPGVFIAQKSIREYQTSPGLAHILGYTGIVSPEDIKKNPDYYMSDRIGKTGLESEYEKYLRGIYGVEQIEVDSKHNIQKVIVNGENKEPVSGDDLVLNIDFGLQQTTAQSLQAGLAAGAKETGQDVKQGVALVMDVKTGGIISMVSLPDYNDNLFSTQIGSADYQSLMNDPNLPMFNRAIAGAYPPGSISKIILASAGLAEGNITVNTSITTPAAIKIGDYTFPDWKDHSYESTNVEAAIAQSNDIFFYAVGGGFDKIKGLGIDAIKKWWQLFGLGERTGIDLPSEASGLLPDGSWKQKVKGEPWYLGDTYHVSIGQGDMLVTPIQMLRATAAIANGGILLEPQLVQKIVDPSGNVAKQFGPRVERQNFISPSDLAIVQQGMRQTIMAGGSAHSIFPDNYPVQVAGKTGTAQFDNNTKTHSWFEAYAPYNNPQIAVLVLVEGGGEGYSVAAPVAKDILSYYFAH